MAYTPPAGNAVDFLIVGGYTPPSGSTVDFAWTLTAYAAAPTLLEAPAAFAEDPGHPRRRPVALGQPSRRRDRTPL